MPVSLIGAYGLESLRCWRLRQIPPLEVASERHEIASGTSAGVNFGLNISEDWQVELSFSRQSTDFTARGIGPAVDL